VFQTVKPLKLIKKIIQIWCPPRGLVLDPYAGSGTTGHAVLELNQESQMDRRFILIEQGSPANGDKYARTLTWQRLHNVITGQRPGPDGKFTNGAEPMPGGFEFRMLTRQIDAKTVLSMKKDELVDVVITSHWDWEDAAAQTSSGSTIPNTATSLGVTKKAKAILSFGTIVARWGSWTGIVIASYSRMQRGPALTRPIMYMRAMKCISPATCSFGKSLTKSSRTSG